MKLTHSFLFSFIIFSAFVNSQVDLENKVKSQFNLNYDLNIIDDPMSFRNYLIKDQQLANNYINFVLDANRSWYFKYFNRNSMRNSGWNSYDHFYDNRFLAWNSWRNNLFFSVGDFEWFKPSSSYSFTSNYYFTDIQYYSMRLLSQRLYISNQSRLTYGKEVIQHNISHNLNKNSKQLNENVKTTRDDILTVLEKKGKKFKVVSRSAPGYNLNNVGSRIIDLKRRFPHLYNNNKNYRNTSRKNRRLLDDSFSSSIKEENFSGQTIRRPVFNNGGSNSSVGGTKTISKAAKQ